jgi:hypothetical protein
MDLSLTPNQADSELLSRTMRVLSYQEAKEGVSRQVEEPLQDKGGGLTKWDLSFAEYIEEHKNSKLLFCRYGSGLGIVFSPADHHGIWAMQREGTLSKGIVPDHLVAFLEDLAKRKGLV